MNLEQVTAELRPRETWEAVDFGARLVRRDAGIIYPIWFAITLPLLLAAMAVAYWTPFGTFALIAYWWLEPIADGPLLQVIAQRLFGGEVSRWSALRQVFSLAIRNRIFWLSPYRFHFARSVAMPITQLEGLSGRKRRARARVINREAMNHGTGLTIVCQHLWLALYLGVTLIVFALIPEQYQASLGDDWVELFVSESKLGVVVSLAVFYCAQSILQPWFVGGGFGLYLNRRTHLEAWDVEIAFRRMVARRQAGARASVLLVMCAIVIGGVEAEANASELPKNDESAAPIELYFEHDSVADGLARTFEKPELATEQTYTAWEAIEKAKEQEPRDNSGWRAVAEVFAVISEFGLWIIVAVLLLLILVNANRLFGGLRPRLQRVKAPEILLHDDVPLTAKSLPDNVPEAVLELWQSGQAREALALLYRASIFHAVRRHDLVVKPGATERDCLALVTAGTTPAVDAVFRQVVGAWQRLAYAQRKPDDDTVTMLCSQWASAFEAGV